MRVELVGGGDAAAHAPTRALARQLRAAGNEVDVVGHGGRRGLLERLRGGPRLVVPATRGDLELAVDRAGRDGFVAAPVPWGLDPDHDVAWHAPDDLAWSSSPAGRGLGHHLATAAAADDGSTPAPGRHAGRSLAIVARWSATTPARYLAAAAERAGVRVQRLEALDARLLDAPVDGVLVVESPLPALPVGQRPPVPVLLWAHHGEHHTDTHVRLCHRYGVDAVLLAHSWHLAHRFPRPVHRFPFGLPASLVAADRPFDERRWDVAFVGSGTDGGGAYRRRGELLASLRAALPTDRVRIEEGVPPEQVAAVYGDARLVPNDCGSRHRPITMRVLEAVGAGAVLLTDDAPGLDRLLDPAAHHVVIDDPVGEQAAALLADRAALAGRAAAALDHARRHHTTDHRVDELLAVLDATTVLPPLPATPVPADPLLRPVADDLLLDDVLPLGVADAEEQLPDRAVWPADRLERLADRPLAHAVVVGAGVDVDADRVVRAARRLVVAPPDREDVVAAALAARPDAVVRSRDEHAVAVDLGTPGYRVPPVPRS